MLEEVTTVESRQDVAMTLVKIYLGQGLVVPFLDYLNTREVNHTSKINGITPELFKISDHCQAEPFVSVMSERQNLVCISISTKKNLTWLLCIYYVFLSNRD